MFYFYMEVFYFKNKKQEAYPNRHLVLGFKLEKSALILFFVMNCITKKKKKKDFWKDCLLSDCLEITSSQPNT